MTLSVEDLPLSELDPAGRKAVCSAVVRAARRQVDDGLKAQRAPGELLRQLSEEFDALLRALCVEVLPAARDTRVSVVALGGYGRRELYPHSDLDLLFLHEGVDEALIESIVGRVVYPLWDAKVAVGHAAREVSEALELAGRDLAMRTALLDARLLAGDERPYRELCAGAHREFFGPDRVNRFVEELAAERTGRHARFGESVYLLEPNIKSNKGGLRDINTALWAVKARFGSGGFAEVASHGGATPRQAAAMTGAHEFLRGLRLAMHLHAGRAQDQLTFAIQEHLAPRLFPEAEIPGARHHRSDSAVALAVERLMHAFYRHAQTVVIETEGILERCRVPEDDVPPPVERIDDHFVAVGEWLSCPSPEVFWEDPAQLVSALRISLDRGLRLDRQSRDAMAEAIASDPGVQLQADEKAAQRWLDLLARDDLGPMLREMHEIGLLAALVPEFGPCTGRVQHDIYHVYTVDQHTLFVVGLLHDLRGGSERQTYPRPTEVMRELTDPLPLYLAALLHDVGKPLGSGHARSGARLAAGVAARLGLSRHDQETVVFLVREHLTMAHISQRRDLGDPEAIGSFAAMVEDPDRLRALYLLTVADTAMTCPGNLTDWKASLLDELYLRATQQLEGADDGSRALVATRRQQLRAFFEQARGEAAGALVDRLPERLLLVDSQRSLEHHLGVVLDLLQDPAGKLKVGTRPRDDASGAVELTVSCDDAVGLLAAITGVLYTLRIGVLSAQIYTLSVGRGRSVVLDIFNVEPPAGDNDEETGERIKERLSAAIGGALKIEDEVRALGRPARLPDRVVPPVNTVVTFDNEASRQWSVIEVQAADRPGLLHFITRALTGLQLEIGLAMISTEQGRVVDSFYVQDRATGGKIDAAAQQGAISERLTREISLLGGEQSSRE